MPVLHLKGVLYDSVQSDPMVEETSQQQPSRRGLLYFCFGCLILFLTAWFLYFPWRCRQVRSALARREFTNAVTLATRLVQSSPQAAEGHYLLAKAARRSGDFTEAAAELKRAEELAWNPIEIQRESILARVQSGQIETCKPQLKTIFASDLDHDETTEVYEALANGHLAAFDGPEFQQCLNYWIDWDPKAIQPRLMRAQFFERLANHTDAEKCYADIVQDHPDCREARLGQAACLIELNQPSAAIEPLKACLEQEREPRAAVLLAKSWIQTGEMAPAGRLLTEFADTANEAIRAEVLEQLGRWHLDQRQAPEAIQRLEAAVQLTPENGTAWHALAAAYSLSGNPEKAAQALKTSQDSLTRLQRLAELMVQINLNPQKLELRMEVAQILFEQKLDKDAVAWLNTILHQDLHHASANELLAQYYERIGNAPLARQHRAIAQPPAALPQP